ncbi:MAG: HEAT repeat domain-containing protein [Nitrospirae bacterium]|nr:HEAT repeat domain-containing protein [Nitrospirota bacterium]
MKVTIRMPKLLKDLTHEDISKRRTAAELLAAGDERAVYPLLKALRDENPGVQDAAMRSLIAIGGGGSCQPAFDSVQPTVGEVTAYMVIPLLREDSYLRNTAIIILREIGAPTVPLLYSLLRDKDDDVRKFALDLLIDINQDVDADKILPLLRDPNQNVRASAAKAVGVVMHQAGLPYLIQALQDDEWVVFSVLEALSKIKDNEAVRAIVDLLNSPSVTLRFAAIEALGSIESPAASAPLLKHFLKADDMEKREAVKSLVKIGVTPSMSEISAILIDMLKNGDWEERLIALKGIVDLGEEKAVTDIVDIGGSLDPSEPESEDRLYRINETLRAFGCSDNLISCLDNPAIKYRGRVLAIEIIGELKCEKAVPFLVKLIEGNFRDVRRASVRALGEISDDESRQALEEAVNDYDSHVRKAAINALGRIGDRSSFAILLKLLGVEQYRDVLEEIIQSMIMLNQDELFSHVGEFDASRKEILAKYVNDQDTLTRLAGDEDLQVRIAAVSGLGRIGTDIAQGRLREIVKDPDPSLRKAAIMAMGNLRCCYADIKAALHDEDMWVRIYAVKALGRSEDPGMIDVLILMLNDKEIPVVLSTIDAIAQIGGREAFKALAYLEAHENPAIREKAVQTLENL